MTRFARAKGSKASNERVPEEPTPWHVMKQQVEESKIPKNHHQQAKSAKELLKEKDELYYSTTVDNVKTDWAEFEPQDMKAPQNNKQNSTETPLKKIKKEKHLKIKENESQTPSKSKALPENSSETLQETVEITPKSNKKSKKRKSDVSNEEFITEEKSDTNETTMNLNTNETVSAKKKKKKDKKMSQSSSPTSENSSEQSKEVLEEKKSTEAQAEAEVTEKPSVKLSKRQKRNRKNRKTNNVSEESEKSEQENQSLPGKFNTEGNDWNTTVNFGNRVNSNKVHQSSDPQDQLENENNPPENNFKGPVSNFKNQKPIKKRKPPKIRDDKEHKRRKPNPGSSKVIINGMEVEIVMYDGFPVRKEDAERLTELRKELKMKGIPNSEINAAMKLERRKAEKALTRIKKNVCFHCRKAGHNLSDCPELGVEEAATGICFKCGSTEHTHFECKVTKKEEFRFATCFICREQGHIAKQCPDNPKGLYPDGGSCKICGDVTHLKKDCPDVMKEKEETTITLDTIVDSNLEALDNENSINKSEKKSERSKCKVVKF